MLYLQCSKSFWLLKHKPSIYPKKEFTKFMQKLVKDGYEVEEYAQKIFPDGVSLFGKAQSINQEDSAVEKTIEALKTDKKVFFQPTFQTDDGMFARLDILEKNDDNSYNIYEVKSSSKIKEDKKIKPDNANHIKDICFQKIVLEKLKYKVKDLYIIYTNKDYVLKGEIDIGKFLKKDKVNDMVDNIYCEVLSEVSIALNLLKEKNIDEKGCGCVYKPKAYHCDSFEYFNGKLDSGSIYEFPRISESKIVKLCELDILKAKDVGDCIDLTTRQTDFMYSLMNKKPVIFQDEIISMFNTLKFPLYFLDYEAYSSAVPKIIGTSPWQQVPFQFSLHILHENGDLEHKESLSSSLFGIEGVFDDLKNYIEPVGSVVVWYKAFEMTRNKEMSKHFPKHSEFLINVNDRIFDLMEVFVKSYIDGRFSGSFSIKKVLPIICPQFSYSELDIQDGTSAMDQWLSMISSSMSEPKRGNVYKALLEYCKLDTLAMVELYKFLKNIADAK